MTLTEENTLPPVPPPGSSSQHYPVHPLDSTEIEFSPPHALFRVVRDQVRDKLDFAFEDAGEQRVKNIARPLRVYRLRPAQAPGEAIEATQPRLALPDKPSVAVLPFTNMSGDPEQEFVSDGIAEDVITVPVAVEDVGHRAPGQALGGHAEILSGLRGPEGIEDQGAVGRSFLLPGHVMPSVGHAPRRQAEARRRHQSFENPANRLFPQV